MAVSCSALCFQVKSCLGFGTFCAKSTDVRRHSRHAENALVFVARCWTTCRLLAKTAHYQITGEPDPPTSPAISADEVEVKTGSWIYTSRSDQLHLFDFLQLLLALFCKRLFVDDFTLVPRRMSVPYRP
jgi:hypothetical protein